MKTDLFHFCGHGWVFQICWCIECSTFTASSFRIWNSSAGIPSSPLALFVVILPKVHLSSHPRMWTGSRWVTTPSWSYRSLRAFLHTSFVYPCLLFLIFSTYVRLLLFLSFFAYLCMKYSFGMSNLLKISLVFPILSFLSIYLHWLLRNAFFSLFAVLWSSAFSWVYLSLYPLPFASLLF